MKIAPLLLVIAVLAAAGAFVLLGGHGPGEAVVTSGDRDPTRVHGDDGDPVGPAAAESTGSVAERERLDAPAAEAPPSLPRADLLTARVRVRVVSEARRPLDGVHVRLTAGSAENVALPVPFPDFTAEGHTDDEGRSELAVPPAGALTASVEKQGFSPRTVGSLLPGDDVTVTLFDAHALPGRVVADETGEGIVGALVQVRGPGARTSIETGADGTFHAEPLPRGTYDVAAVAVGFDRIEQSGWIAGVGRAAQPVVRLPAGARVRGRVVERPAGLAVVGAVVTARYLEAGGAVDAFTQDAVTDAGGAFELEPLPRRGVELRVEADGFVEWASFLKIGPDDDVHDVAVELVRGRTLAGRVVDSMGEPVPGASVFLDGPRHEEIEADATGAFTFDGLSAGASYSVAACCPTRGLAPASLAQIALGELESDRELELRLAPGATVEGKVIDGLGRPVPFAQVRIDGVPWFVWRALDEKPLRAAGEDGRFAFVNLPEGSIRIAARRGDEAALAQELALAAGGRHTVELVLDQGAIVTGVVVDASGVPIDDALLTAFAVEEEFELPAPPPVTAAPASVDAKVAGRLAERELHRRVASKSAALRRATSGKEQWKSFRALARSGADGRFELAGLDPSEKLVILAQAEGCASQHVFNVEPGGRETRIVLKRLLELSGRVVDARTRLPLESFQVNAAPVKEALEGRDLGELLARPSPRGDAFSSPEGAFLLGGLHPVAYDVTAQAPGYRRTDPARVDLAALGTSTILLELLPAALVEGRVRAVDGSGVPGVQVFLRPDSSNSDAFETAPKKKEEILRRVVAPDGSFSFHDPGPSAYVLGVGDPKQPLVAPVSIQVREGQRVEHDFVLDGLGEVQFEVDKESGFGLRNAGIRLRGMNKKIARQGSTDAMGRATFSNLVPDDYEVTVTAKGHVPGKELINVQPGDRRDLRFRLASGPP